MYRDHTRAVKIGDREIGGGRPILIQSMTNTRTEDVGATVAQILELEQAGCEIVRCTVPTEEAAKAVGEIKKQIHIPLVADIHFDYKMAIAAMEHGADKIRINPGNIGGADRVRAVVEAAKERDIPIRVGVNSGSLEKNLLEKYGGVTAEGIVESAMDKVGDYEIQIGKSAHEILLREAVHVESEKAIPKTFHLNSTLGEILADPKGKMIMEQAMGGAMGAGAAEMAKSADKDDAINAEMMAAMMEAMPLRQLLKIGRASCRERV